MDVDTPTEHSSRTPTSWQTDVAMAALSGIVTAYLPVQKWPRWAQWAMHGGMGAATAGAAGYLMSRPGALDDADGTSPSPPPPAALTAVVAALGGLTVAGLSRGGQAADTWLERTLVERGVRRPRRWLGVAAAGASLAMSAAERRRG